MYFILLLVYFYAISYVMDLSSLGVSDGSPWWTLFTYNVIHISFIHLLVNSIVFVSYWGILKRFLNVYMVICISLFASVVSAYLGSASVPTVGASAVIYSFSGIYMTSIPLPKREMVKFVLMILASFIFTGLFAQGVNTEIHIYSFVISIVAGLLARRYIYEKA